MSTTASLALELCTFSGDEPLLHHFNLKDGVRTAAASTVLRHCEISLPGRDAFRSLTELLEAAEEHFGIFEEETGVATVPHRWGLYPLEAALARDSHLIAHFNPRDDRLRAKHGYNLLPAGTLLAAEVAVVEESEAPHDGYSGLKLAVTNYDVRSSEEEVHLYDMAANQCLFGKPRQGAALEADAYYLVDIEPRFCVTVL